MFEWDTRKAAEQRFGRVGRSATGRVLALGYAPRRVGDVQSVRIITARQASRKERAAYAAARD